VVSPTGLLARVDLRPTGWSLALTPAHPACLDVLRTALRHAEYSSTGDKANGVLPNESVAPREGGLAGRTPCEGLVRGNDGVPARRLAGADKRPCTPPLSAAPWDYRRSPQPVGVQTRAASTVSAARSSTPGR
jgi:hypothetical protein